MATLVNRATSGVLSGPDWAMNMELCDLIHNDPGVAKDAIKAVKKRMGNKNTKVQLLALTVLETLIKNCGDVVHHQVVAKDVLHEMVKIAKKNKDMQVKERILFLVDTWQEGFGGPNGRYPQYFLAYDELRRSGAMFPRRTENSTPIFTPPQTRPIAANFPSPPRSPRRMPAETNASRALDLPGLSLSDIHNARSGMEVLAEMLSAIDPRNNKQALRDEVIMELVEQCYTAERRVVQLVNTTSDEELLRQGLALNDDIKKVLAKHDAIASGVPLPQEPSSAPPSLIDHKRHDSDDVLSQLSHRSTTKGKASSSASGGALLALPAPTPPQAQPQNAVAPPAMTRAPTIDLLSGDAFQTESSTALAPTPPPIQDSLSSLSIQGTSNYLSNGAGFLSQAKPPPIYNNHQAGQNNMHYNGMLPGQYERPQEGNNYGQMPGQFNNNYVVPWAAQPPAGYELGSGSYQHGGFEQSTSLTGSSTLSPQQAALIYGTSHPTSQQSGSPFSPRPQQYASAEQLRGPQGDMLYAPQGSSMAPPLPPSQGYGSPVQSQQPLYMSPHIHPGSHAYNLSGPTQQSLSPQSVNSHLPPAPWSMENALPTEPQQRPFLYGNAMVPSFSVQNSDSRQQVFPQPFASSGLYPSFTQPNAGLTQSFSNQGQNSYYPLMQQQSAGLYTQQSDYTMFQNQGVFPRKEEKAEDKLFKDLVDIAKTKKVGASGKG